MLNKSASIIISYFILVYVVYCCYGSNEDSEVVLVHALFRHGERTPSSFYPNDPYKNKTFYPIGLGGLTNKGKLMMFKLGEILRSTYNTLLGDTYTEDKVYVRSRHVKRTTISALLLLAGMWPPNEQQKWHNSLNWQPIAVESKNKEEEDLMNPVCNTLRLEASIIYKNSTVYETYIQPHKKEFDYLKKNSGLKMRDFRNIAKLYLTLKTEKDNGLQLPEWTNTIYPQPLYRLAALQYVYRNLLPNHQVTNSGLLMQKILADSFAKINNTLKPSDRRIFLYSAHETTIGYLLYNMKVFKHEIPDYSDCILFELRKKQKDYFIKLRYVRTIPNATIEDLTIPNCENLCPIHRFQELQTNYLPTKSFKEHCY